MSEIERLHQQRLEREKKQPQGERRDPTEWQPRPNPDYERADANLSATEVRSEPLNYQSLAQYQPGVIAGIEARARGDLVRAMDQRGVTVDERGVRVHWRLVVEGYGFKYPEGFVHPEAPDDVKREGREAWKRIVEQASDSLSKFLFVKVWRRKHSSLSASAPKAIERGEDIVDAEVVEE